MIIFLFPLLKSNREMPWLFQSVQYSIPWYRVRPNGWMSAADDITNRLLAPVRSETSIWSSLASAQYRRLVDRSMVSPFGQPRFPVITILLDEPSIAACSIFGLDPQSVQYIVLSKETLVILILPGKHHCGNGLHSSYILPTRKKAGTAKFCLSVTKLTITLQ